MGSAYRKFLLKNKQAKFAWEKSSRGNLKYNVVMLGLVQVSMLAHTLAD